MAVSLSQGTLVAGSWGALTFSATVAVTEEPPFLVANTGAIPPSAFLLKLSQRESFWLYRWQLSSREVVVDLDGETKGVGIVEDRVRDLGDEVVEGDRVEEAVEASDVVQVGERARCDVRAISARVVLDAAADGDQGGLLASGDGDAGDDGDLDIADVAARTGTDRVESNDGSTGKGERRQGGKEQDDKVAKHVGVAGEAGWAKVGLVDVNDSWDERLTC